MSIKKSNIVNQNNLRKTQQETLQKIKDVLSLTAGPYGSNTMLMHDKRFTEYSKDGFKVLRDIQFYDPIEREIKEELVELTRHIVKTVGDGTTSSVIMSSLIFDQLCKYQSDTNIPPYKLIESFKKVVGLIKEEILKQKREVTVDDIYKICMISTNGNEEISTNIKNIYEEYGMDVFIDVAVSNTTENIVKSYDGLTLEVGYPSAAFVNSSKGTTEIRNAHIYAFADPIDTPEMVSFFQKIIYDNIISNIDTREFVPTVIITPSITRDANSDLEQLESMLYNYDANKMTADKPPILIITGVHGHKLDQYMDIVRLCGCDLIRKYIDPELQKKDIEEGKAPTIDTISEWYGEVDLVSCDTTKTKFINPKHMFEDELDENGNRVYSTIYNGLLGFVQKELDNAIKEQMDANVTGNLKRRLNSLKANMVEYLIGGISVTDRDSLRDLVEDAVLNCRSAVRNGVGYGCNFEGARATLKVLNELSNSGKDIEEDLALCIHMAYKDILELLYSTAMKREKAMTEISESFYRERPINLRTLSYDDKDEVLCTIDSDIVILDSIAKIITIIFTSNQALLVSPLNNVYIDEKDV